MYNGYVQRQIALDMETRKTGKTGKNALHGMVFQSIAGDSTASVTTKPSDIGNVLQNMDHLQLGIMDANTVRRLSVTAVTNASPTNTMGCLSDLRMGASHTQNCATCKNNYHNCPGHFGRIELPYAVYNPMFVGLLSNVLQCLCISCNRLRLSPWYIRMTIPSKLCAFLAHSFFHSTNQRRWQSTHPQAPQIHFHAVLSYQYVLILSRPVLELQTAGTVYPGQSGK